jgi:hypothetical protein
VVLCLETSSDVNTLSSMSDILDFAVLFYIVVGILLLFVVMVVVVVECLLMDIRKTES